MTREHAQRASTDAVAAVALGAVERRVRVGQERARVDLTLVQVAPVGQAGQDVDPNWGIGA